MTSFPLHNLHSLSPSTFETEEATPTTHGGDARPDLGKARSRQNALQHGLCATALLPDVLGGELLQQHKERLRAEWQPTSSTQEFLVEEMARHAAALERVEQAEAAVLRCGARGIPDLLAMQPTLADSEMDLLLAGAVTSEAIDRVTRYRRAHEKGWHTALKRLLEAKAMEERAGPRTPPVVRPSFTSEAECEAYLWRRWQRPDRPDFPCGHVKAYWLPTCRRWQCASCKRQFGLRSGTAMEHSPLPLTLWFAAIELFVQNPRSTITALSDATGHRRPATLRHIASRIRAALASDRVSLLLAGLDRVFRSARPRLPEASVPASGHFAKRILPSRLDLEEPQRN